MRSGCPPTDSLLARSSLTAAAPGLGPGNGCPSCPMGRGGTVFPQPSRRRGGSVLALTSLFHLTSLSLLRLSPSVVLEGKSLGSPRE